MRVKKIGVAKEDFLEWLCEKHGDLPEGVSMGSVVDVGTDYRDSPREVLIVTLHHPDFKDSDKYYAYPIDYIRGCQDVS